VKDNRNAEAFSKFYPDEPDREPDLNWVFLRKYSPDAERSSLQHHHDTNMNTLNIELSDDYEGGGLFYIKPLASTVTISKKYKDAGYEWIDSIKKENTTDIVFPDLHAGNAIFYNYTVSHAVAPVESGTRYSMAFFFDTDNPAVQDAFEEDDEDENELKEGEFEVEVHNGLPDIEVDIVQVLEIAGEEVLELKFDKVIVSETIIYAAYEGDRLRALRAGTMEVIADIEIKRDIALYRISRVDSMRLDYPLEYLEPNVQRHVGVLPQNICKQIIDLGKKAGFLVDYESIDEDEQNDPDEKYVPAQSMDIYDKGTNRDVDAIANIENEAIWNILQLWIPKITQIVKDNRNAEAFSKFYPDEPDREPDLNWVFLRKYSPDAERSSLQHHHDTNMNTLNIELSDDYEGGGLFYIKPLASTGKIAQEYSDTMKGYEWIDSVKRENTTDIVFPDLHAGDAIFYNYTVEHGVAPVKSGTRYSMAFFFDMDNPAVDEDFEDDNEDEDEFEVELHNGLPDIELDIVQVLDIAKEEVWEIKFDNVTFNETATYYAHEGDRLRALRAGTVEVVFDIDIKRDQPLYTISRSDSTYAI